MDLSRYNTVIPLVTLLFIRDEKVLIIDRGEGCCLYRGWSELPGGKIKEHELDPRKAALREAREETGMEITDLELLEVRTFPPDNERPLPGHAHLFRVTATGDVKISEKEKDKVTNPRWLEKDQALKLRLTDWSRYFITRHM